jgi:hypothetical protein
MIAMLAERRCVVNVRRDEAMLNGRGSLGARRALGNPRKPGPPHARASS